MKRDKNILISIIVDLKFISDWAGEKFSCKEARRLIKVNYERYIDHLKKHGDISEFQYE